MIKQSFFEQLYFAFVPLKNGVAPNLKRLYRLGKARDSRPAAPIIVLIRTVQPS
jgi:hypothetical protein